MSDRTMDRAPNQPHHSRAGLLGGVARGGMLNLAGAAVYGLANFALLMVLTRQLGVSAAGSVLIAIALFNIVSRTAEFGCSTGLIRWISRWRALNESDRIPGTLLVALVPVAVGGVLGAIAMILAGTALARVFAGSGDADNVADVVRAMAPFLPFAVLYSVIIGGTRGFGTMVPQVVIEKLGRGAALPVIVGLGAAAGVGSVGIGAMWAATSALALIPAAIVMRELVHRSVHTSTADRTNTDDACAPAARVDADVSRGELARDYWSYTAPRAAGQVSEVAINWLDTIVVGALISTAAAGVYAAGTRFLLPGLFVGEALMQVTAPVVSGLLVGRRNADATHLVQAVAGWGTVLLWPTYLVVLVFAPVLLRIFGPEVVAATGALRALSVAVLIGSLFGPSHSVILMSGRSRQAMFNTFVLLAVNLGANLWLVPIYGITAAGVAWAATIVVGAALPAWQARQALGVTTVGAPALRAAGCAVVTVGSSCAVALAVWGVSPAGLCGAVALGVALFVPIVAKFGQLEIASLFNETARQTNVPAGAGGS